MKNLSYPITAAERDRAIGELKALMARLRVSPSTIYKLAMIAAREDGA